MPDVSAGPTWPVLPASTWSDALDRLRIPGVASGLTWRSGAPPLAGRAVTVRESVGALGDHGAAAFDVGRVIASIGGGDVLVIEMGGALVSSFGGLAARAAARRGVGGVVVDGGCRDLDEIRATGLKVCSRHVTPISGRERVRIDDVNVPILFAGLHVSPGDFVAADETGIVVVPSGRYDETLAMAQELDRRDRAFVAALDAGQAFGDAARALGHLSGRTP